MSKEIKPLVRIMENQLTAVLFGMDTGNYMMSLSAGLKLLESSYRIIAAALEKRLAELEAAKNR
jgi:hypothetical protein